jgi:hypothetical protein
MKHNITIKQPAAWLLGLYLSRPGWAKTEGASYRAAKIAYRILPDLDIPVEVSESRDQRQAEKAQPDWCRKTIEIVLTDGQRDVVKQCLKEMHAQGVVYNGPWMMELDELFGLAPEDELPAKS